MKALGIFFFAVVLASAAAQAQECREPTARERAAIFKAVTTLQKTVVTPLLASGWTISGNQSALTKQVVVATNADPPRPIFDCSTFFDVRLAASSDNPRAAAAKQAMQQITGSTSQADLGKIVAVMASAEIHFRAGINEPSMPHGRFYQVAGKDPGTLTTTMCFGRLPFRHGAGTPYVENLCLTMHTSTSVTRELLKQLNWSRLNRALTR